MKLGNIVGMFKDGSLKTALKGSWKDFGMKMVAMRPDLMMVTGCGFLLMGTIAACTKTNKAKKVIDETKQKSVEVEKTLKIEDSDEIKLTQETKKQLKIERGKQYFGIYAHAVYEMVKIYGIPALMWFSGMGMVVGSHVELKNINRHLAADIFAGNKLMQEYRQRVAKAVGDETEKKIYLGAQEGMVKVLETDPETGEKKLVEKKADVFLNQPGSIFALNFTNETSDAFDIRYMHDRVLKSRTDQINLNLELGVRRAYSAFEIYRILGFNESAFGDDDEVLKKMANYGISGNARKVPDPEMRKLKITVLEGYQERWSPEMRCKVYEPCMRLDFNFYPLDGKI